MIPTYIHVILSIENAKAYRYAIGSRFPKHKRSLVSPNLQVASEAGAAKILRQSDIVGLTLFPNLCLASSG
jgi:hypothetical protein